jgi:ABC-type phosphate transport system substrate-binding protein
LLAALIGFGSAGSSAQQVVANADVTDTDISRNEARLFFTMRLQYWPNKRPVTVFVLPDDHPLHIAFAKTILGLFPYQLRRVWDRQLFSGTGQAPITVANEEEMLRRVATTPGAIGYLQRPPRDTRILPIRVR